MINGLLSLYKYFDKSIGIFSPVVIYTKLSACYDCETEKYIVFNDHMHRHIWIVSANDLRNQNDILHHLPTYTRAL